jgi:hypothetical protein
LQHAHRLVAGGNAEQIAKGQDARADVGSGRLAQIEVGELLVAGVDLQHGDFGERIGAHEFSREAATVVEHHGHVVAVEYVAPSREDVAFGGN